MNPKALAARRVRHLLTADAWITMCSFLAATRHHVGFRNDARSPTTSTQSAKRSDYGAGITGAKRLQKIPSPKGH